MHDCRSALYDLYLTPMFRLHCQVIRYGSQADQQTNRQTVNSDTVTRFGQISRGRHLSVRLTVCLTVCLSLHENFSFRFLELTQIYFVHNSLLLTQESLNASACIKIVKEIVILSFFGQRPSQPGLRACACYMAKPRCFYKAF